ncbi:MAG: spermidine synthase [Bacteroidia bacterium]
MKWSKHNLILLSLSFLEGGALMASELLSARMLAPYFGSSVFVWSAVLGITLGALALGYYQGGALSQSDKREKFLFLALLIAGCLLMLQPLNAQWILSVSAYLSFYEGVALSALVIILPPVMFMGMVSPLMVANLDHSIESAGKRAGIVYTVSTTGGIVFTFLYGFYIIPEFGIIIPAITTGILLAVWPAYFIFKYGWKNSAFFLIGIFISIGGYLLFQKNSSSIYTVHYQTEGILGQVMVTDIPILKNNKKNIERTLFVNRIIQTSYNPQNDEFNDFTYFNNVGKIIKQYDKGSQILVLGLGGGVIARDAYRKGFSVDAVELDQRIIEVARKYFNLEPEINVYCDDARHYLNSCTKKYDIILFDLFRGEETPAHVFTAESINKTKQILKPGGLVLINTHGYYKNEIGKGTRSLYKTMRAMGLLVKLFPTEKTESQSNMLFVGTNELRAFENKIPTSIHTNAIDEDALDLKNAQILTDRQPVLDHLNQKATLSWRLAYQAYNRSLNKSGLPLFN